ncbi:hypothetical protein C8J57DRAFT_1656593, partial [Mycena rebaudengoi]
VGGKEHPHSEKYGRRTSRKKKYVEKNRNSTKTAKKRHRDDSPMATCPEDAESLYCTCSVLPVRADVRVRIRGIGGVRDERGGRAERGGQGWRCAESRRTGRRGREAGGETPSRKVGCTAGVLGKRAGCSPRSYSKIAGKSSRLCAQRLPKSYNGSCAL